MQGPKHGTTAKTNVNDRTAELYIGDLPVPAVFYVVRNWGKADELCCAVSACVIRVQSKRSVGDHVAVGNAMRKILPSRAMPPAQAG